MGTLHHNMLETNNPMPCSRTSALIYIHAPII